MIRTTTAATGLFVLMLAIPSGAALHCNGDITTISAGGNTLYLDDRSDETGQINHWFYEESNDREGLQTGNHDCPFECTLPPYSWSDPCAHADPDFLIL